MIPTTDYIRFFQQERERQAAADRLARLAARIRDCCTPSRFTRLVRTMRGTPATCC